MPSSREPGPGAAQPTESERFWTLPVVEPNFQILRRHRRSLLLRLEHAHRSAVENHVHRAPRLGSRRSFNLRIGISQAFHFQDKRVRAGGVLCDSLANAQSGDTVWTGLNSNTIPAGATPIDGSATTAYNASRWAGITWGPASGRDSIDA